MGTVSLKQFDLPGNVFGRGGVAPIRQDQFLAVFDVAVDLNGCYAVVVRLVEDNSETLTIISFGSASSFDRTIAANTSAEVKAYCFDAGATRTFSISTSTAPPKGQAPLQPPATAVQLAPLNGFWPKSEVGSEIEVRLEVNVYLLRPTPCGPDDDCPPAKTNGLRDMEPRVSFASTLVDVELLDGDDPLINTLGDVGKASAKGLLGFAGPADKPSDDSNQALAFVVGETARLRRETRRLQSNVNALGARLPRLGIATG